MEEPSSEDSANIDFILSSLRENTNIRTEHLVKEEGPRFKSIMLDTINPLTYNYLLMKRK